MGCDVRPKRMFEFTLIHNIGLFPLIHHLTHSFLLLCIANGLVCDTPVKNMPEQQMQATR